MKRLRLLEVDVPIYHFRLQKNIDVLYNKVMFRVEYSQRNGVVSFHIVLLNETFPMLSCVTQMEIICKSYTPRKIDVASYHFGVHITIIVSYSNVMFLVYYSERLGVFLFHYFSPQIDL